MPDAPWYDDVAVPALLAGGRRTYGSAIGADLLAAGFTDMPRRGAGVIGGIARNGKAMRDVGEDLGMSKQATSQLVDQLVIRGYVERTIDPADRRRMQLGLTERGVAAAKVVRAANDRVDAALIAQVGAQDLAATRKVMAALINLDTGAAG